MSVDSETFSVPVVDTSATVDVIPVDEEGVGLKDQEHLEMRIEARLQEVEQQCQEHLRRAEAQAQDILEQARTNALQIRQEAMQQGREEGYTTGYEEGLAACQSTCDDLIKKTQEIVQEAKEHRGVVLRSMTEPLVHLVTEAVSVVLQRELELTPANVEQIVSELLRHVMDSNSVEIRVHPDDFITATEAHPKWLAAKFGEWEVVVVPDPGVQRGGCEVRSEDGRIDAQIGTRMQLLQEDLRRIVSEEVSHRVG